MMIQEFISKCVSVLVWSTCAAACCVFAGVGVRLVGSSLLAALAGTRRKCGMLVVSVLMAVSVVCTVVAQKENGGASASPKGAQAVSKLPLVASRNAAVPAAKSPLAAPTRSPLCALSPSGPEVEPFAAKPANAVENHWWRGRGAHVDGLTIPAEGWNFRTPSGFLESLLVYSYGEIQPDVETTYFLRPFPDADLSLLPEGKWGGNLPEGAESLFWHAASPSNSLILTWQNAAYGRDANCPTNLQIELFANGTYVYRYDDRTEHHSVAYPFDLDGDGLENSVDPEPLVAGPDAHGANAEWYNTVCSNVFSKIEQSNNPNNQSTLLPNGESVGFKSGVNTNAYYFVDVVAERGPAPVFFVADGASRLGNPVVIAQAGETNHVPLLIGATYSITSDVPLQVIAPMEVEMSDFAPGGIARRVRWPVPVDYETGDDGRFIPYVPAELQQLLEGSFSWSGGCCVSITGDAITFSCDACGCGGCSAVAAYKYENYSLFLPAITCGCSHNGGDPTRTPVVVTPGGAGVAAGFTRKLIVISDSGTNGVARSTRTVFTLAAWGGNRGGTLTVEPVNFSKLKSVGGGTLPAPSTRTLLPLESYSVVVTNEGVAASESLDDVRIRATFEENGTGTRILRNARLTVCELSVDGLKFNHDIDRYDVDAINIRLNGASNGVYAANLGEWCRRDNANCPACYIGGVHPQVHARFGVKPHGVGKVVVSAQAADGFTLGGIPTYEIKFTEGDSGWVVLHACDGTNAVPRRVDVTSAKWKWRVDSIGGYSMPSPHGFCETGPHKIYTVLDLPKDPWWRYPNHPQCAWTFALERACKWAKGATTANEALAAVTSNLFYNCGFKYDIKEADSHYYKSYNTFNFENYISKTDGNIVNCYDQAHAVFLFGSLLGADVRVKRIVPFGYLRRTQLVGIGDSNNPLYGNKDFSPLACCDPCAPNRSSFSLHYFCMYGNLVLDGCAGPALGTVGLCEYLQECIDSGRPPHGSRPGTTADVSDYVAVRYFE